MEDQIDKLEGEDDTSTSEDNADGENSQDGEDTSFLQVKKHDEDDDNEHAEIARMEDQIDKLEGEDDTSTSEDNADGEKSQDGEDTSFLQVKKHDEDDDNE